VTGPPAILDRKLWLPRAAVDVDWIQAQLTVAPDRMVGEAEEITLTADGRGKRAAYIGVPRPGVWSSGVALSRTGGRTGAGRGLASIWSR